MSYEQVRRCERAVFEHHIALTKLKKPSEIAQSQWVTRLHPSRHVRCDIETAIMSRAVSEADWITHMNVGTPRRLWCAVASCALLLTLPMSAAGGPLSKKL